MDYAKHASFTTNVKHYGEDRPPYRWRYQPKLNRKWGLPWIEALRSGEYQQLYGCMYAGETERCAVGVLCDIAAKMDGIPISAYPTSLAVPLIGPYVLTMVVDLNDFRHWDFNQIADLLETLLESEPELIPEADVQTFVLGPFLPVPALEPVPA